MLRLFAAFDAGLTLIGPVLHVPVTFSTDAGLSQKLDQIGAVMSMDSGFRSVMDRDIRDLRNELMHGRSLVPRRSFEAVHELMRNFRKWCY